MSRPRVLVTCPPMIGLMGELKETFDELGWDTHVPPMQQIVPEHELLTLVPQFDGWIAGDDPVTKKVMAAGRAGRLRGIVKWGVGTDNVDFAGARELGFPVSNTPGVFGEEVADLAVGYVIALARHTFEIDRGVREGRWPKPQGTSLRGKTVALAGYGNIGKAVAVRLFTMGMRLTVYDPMFTATPGVDVTHRAWPDGIEEADFMVFTCPLTPETRHMLDRETLARSTSGVRVVNVARGPIIDEPALIDALKSGKVAGAALDVFEVEPLPKESRLRALPHVILGSHNASNTKEAAMRATRRAIELLKGQLEA